MLAFFCVFSMFALCSSPFYVPFDKQLRDVFISLISLSFCKQLRQVISLLICLSFGKQQIQNNRLLNRSYFLSFCKEKIQIKEANKSPYLLTVFQGAKSK